MHMKYNRKTTLYGSRHWSVDIVMGYGLDGRDSFHRKSKRFFFTPRSVQTGSGAHPASDSMETEGSFPKE
jgi:hypothetical protein